MNGPNQNVNPAGLNQVWAGDVRYLRTDEGWMYWTVVMDLFSRKIVGWHLDKRMTTDWVSEALMLRHLIFTGYLMA